MDSYILKRNCSRYQIYESDKYLVNEIQINEASLEDPLL